MSHALIALSSVYLSIIRGSGTLYGVVNMCDISRMEICIGNCPGHRLHPVSTDWFMPVSQWRM